MIDIHCHIIPDMDDGASGIHESIQMARIAAGDGIARVVATPHIKDSIYPAGLIKEKTGELNVWLADEGIPLEVLHGADVNAMLDPALLRDYTINGTDYLLVEFPHAYLPGNAMEIIFRLVVAGFQPIISHPERNGSILRNPELLLRMMDSGLLVQVTAGSLAGYFGPEVRECAVYLLEKGVVAFLATDAHSIKGRRPVLSEGLAVAESILGKEEASRLVYANPQAVIAGEPLHV